MRPGTLGICVYCASRREAKSGVSESDADRTPGSPVHARAMCDVASSPVLLSFQCVSCSLLSLHSAAASRPPPFHVRGQLALSLHAVAFFTRVCITRGEARIRSKRARGFLRSFLKSQPLLQSQDDYS